MLSAISNNKKVFAFESVKENGPFTCSYCQSSVILKKGDKNVHHFAHSSSSDCPHENESAEHMMIKTEIYKSLKKAYNVTDCELEKSFGENRPDLYAVIDGKPVAIEVQLSNISIEKITERTLSYKNKGIYVLWVTSYERFLERVAVDGDKSISVKSWEKWVHTMYLGQIFLWKKGSTLIPVKLTPSTNLDGTFSKNTRYAQSKKAVDIESDFKAISKDAWNQYPSAFIFNTYAMKKEVVYNSVAKEKKRVNLLKNEKSWFDKILEFFFGSKDKSVCYS